MAPLLPAVAADREAAKQYGQWWGPVVKDSWGALPGASVHPADAAIPEWTADLCGKPFEKEPSTEDVQKYAPVVREAQARTPRLEGIQCVLTGPRLDYYKNLEGF